MFYAVSAELLTQNTRLKRTCFLGYMDQYRSLTNNETLCPRFLLQTGGVGYPFRQIHRR